MSGARIACRCTSHDHVSRSERFVHDPRPALGLMDLAGKVVAMTGAGRGIAEALAERFVAAGARQVVLSDLDEVNVSAVAERLGQPWRRVDVSDASEYHSYLDWIEREIGPIDLCCNNPALHGAHIGLNLETSD